MIRGIYTAGTGMLTQMNRMDVVANNIANSDTTGFRRDLAVTRSFTDRFMNALGNPTTPFRFGDTRRIGQVRPGNFVDEVYTDFSTGSVRHTGNPFDIAIEGEGFFVIQAGEGAPNRYTRSGAFVLDSERTLRTREGHAVLDAQGATISVPDGASIEVNDGGGIMVDGVLAASIGLVSFEDPQSLRKFGENLFDRTEASVEQPFGGRLLAGYLENSNVNTVREMVEMINIQRNFEANQRMVTIQDNTLNLAVNEIARR